MDINKNIAIWRGSNTPPTPYHLWLKDDKLYHYDGISWKENKIDLSTEEKDGLMSKEDKEKLYNLEDRLNELNLSAYLIRGSVETLDDIPYENLLSGDVYNILNPFYIDEKRYPEGTNVVWTGDKLDPLGGTVDFKDYSTTEEVKDMIYDSYNELYNKIDDLEFSKVHILLLDLLLHTVNKSNPHKVTKALVGLGNVTNDAQVKRSEMGVAGGVATLDGTGKVPAALLPAYVDDVLEGTLVNATTFRLVEGQQGEVLLSNVIYIDTITNKSYRWSGTQYVTIASDLALGETSSTAYPGDKGNAATINIKKIKSTALSHIDDTTPVTYSDSKVTVNYECYEGDQYGGAGTKHGADIAAASETTAGVMTAADKNKLNTIEARALVNTVTGVKGNSESSYRTGNINITKDNIGLSNVDNTSDINKPISTALLNALNQKVDKTYVEEQLETKADKADVDEQRISYVSPCFADCAETHESKLKSITLAASVIPSKAIFSVTLKIANNLTLLNQSPVYMHLVDISGNVIGVSQNAVKQVQNKGKYVTWFFDSVINTTEASFVIKLHTTDSASNANDSNFVSIIAHVSQDGGIEGIGVTSDDGTYHTDWTPAIGINVVNLAAIYPQIKELQKYRMVYATSELSDISTTEHKANINEIRINQNTMGISLVSSVSLMVASDNAYNGELYLKVHDINGNLVATSNNSVNLSQNLGAYVTWYFTPFQLTDDAIYRFAAWDNSGNKQVMRIHVASGKSEGVTCFDQNDSPHTDYCPALGINIEPIVTNDILSKINGVKLGVTNVELLVSGKLLTLYVGNEQDKYLLEDGDTIRFSSSVTEMDSNHLQYTLRCNNIPMNILLAPASNSFAGLLTSYYYKKLVSIQEGAQVNVIESIQVGGVVLEISDKLVNIPIASSDDILSILN